MKKKHIYILIAFIILTVLITGIWKAVEQINLQKYNLTEKKISDYQEELKNILILPSDELIEEMTDSYKVAAQKEYEERLNNQTPISNIILISIGISALTSVIAETVIYVIEKRKTKKA